MSYRISGLNGFPVEVVEEDALRPEDTYEDFQTIFGDGLQEGNEEDDDRKFKQIMSNLNDQQARDVCRIILHKHPDIYMDVFCNSYKSLKGLVEGITGSIAIQQEKINEMLGE